MNYRLYHLAAEHVLSKTLPSNNVCDEYKGLTVRQELYRVLQIAYDMGVDHQQDLEIESVS